MLSKTKFLTPKLAFFFTLPLSINSIYKLDDDCYCKIMLYVSCVETVFQIFKHFGGGQEQIYLVVLLLLRNSGSLPDPEMLGNNLEHPHGKRVQPLEQSLIIHCARVRNRGHSLKYKQLN